MRVRNWLSCSVLPVLALMTAAATFTIAQGTVGQIGIDLASSDLGTYLVDEEGISLYVSLEESPGLVACLNECVSDWLPLVIEGEVGLAEGIDASLVGSIVRPDGTTQVTYSQRPLYRYRLDEMAGSVLGHGFGGLWFLIDLGGNPVGASGATEAVEVKSLADLMSEGQPLFERQCAQCHGRNGKGTGGGAAVLVDHPIMSEGGRVARQVLFGGQLMPGFSNVLTDSEVAAVVTYVRNSWGNDFGAFTEEEVIAEKDRFN